DPSRWAGRAQGRSTTVRRGRAGYRFFFFLHFFLADSAERCLRLCFLHFFFVACDCAGGADGGWQLALAPIAPTSASVSVPVNTGRRETAPAELSSPVVPSSTKKRRLSSGVRRVSSAPITWVPLT